MILLIVLYGCHTIAAVTHAYDLAKYINEHREEIGEHRIKFYAKDIMNYINDELRFCQDIKFNSYLRIDLLQILIPYYNDEGIFNIDSNGKVNITSTNEKITHTWKEHISDLLPWYKLAKSLGPDYIITVDYNGKMKEIKAFCFYNEYDIQKHFNTVEEYLKSPYSEINQNYITKIVYEGN